MLENRQQKSPESTNKQTTIHNVLKKKATGTNTAAGSRPMKQNLDMGVEVYDNKVKKKQCHTTNKRPNMYLDIFIKKPTIHKAFLSQKLIAQKTESSF